MLFSFEDGQEWVRWRQERATPGTTAFLESRAGDPRLRPITVNDPIDLDAVFSVSVLAPKSDLVALRTALSPALAGLALFLSEDHATPGLSCLEFHNSEGTKARAVERLMSSLSANRLVVFGDNHNDVPLFHIADESYAVANAIPELQGIATAVIDTNDSGAVARWITSNA